VPTFSELMQQAKKSSGQKSKAPDRLLGVMPVDEDGNLITPAMRLSPRVNLLGKVEVAVPWTETTKAPQLPTLKLKKQLELDPSELTPAAPATKIAAWAQAEAEAQSAPPGAAAPEPQTPSPVAVVAPLWRVLGALMVDAALLLASALVSQAFAARLLGIGPGQSFHLWLLFTFELLLFSFLASGVFGVFLQSRTPGRFLFGIRLVDDTGQRPSPLRSWLRAGLSVFSFGLFLGGFYLALVSRNRQTLHDWLSSTFPVRMDARWP
jgi:uncharacterized RDD family membrane protein YckC